MLLLHDEEKVLLNVRMKLHPKSAPPRRLRASPDTRSWTLPGFGGKSRVATAFGDLPIEAMRLRDPVRTRSGRFLEVRWIDTLQLDAKFLSLHPKSNPILIPKASLERETPNNDILVSPAQSFRMPRNSSDKSTTSAQSIVGRGNVARKPQNGFTYYLFHCGEPTSVNIEGLWFEVTPN